MHDAIHKMAVDLLKLPKNAPITSQSGRVFIMGRDAATVDPLEDNDPDPAIDRAALIASAMGTPAMVQHSMPAPEPAKPVESPHAELALKLREAKQSGGDVAPILAWAMSHYSMGKSRATDLIYKLWETV